MPRDGTPEIRTIAHGEVITEPGFYEMPIDWHHSQCCDGPSVTSSVLRNMALGTPLDVWTYHDLNPNKLDKPETTALRLGRVMAAYIEHGPEGVEDFVRVIASAPESMTVPEMIEHAKAGKEFPKRPPNRPTADQVQKYVEGTATPAATRQVEYWLDIDSDPRVKVNEKEWALICDMGAALKADPVSHVMEGVPEITMAWKDETTGIWCLARPDTVSFSGLSTDYKKMAPAGRPFNSRLVDQRIDQHAYDMQGAFACEGFYHLTGQWPGFGIIAQSDTPPYPVILREIGDEDLQIGKFRNRRALLRFAECLKSGHWPGPGEDVGYYQRPEWMRTKLLEEMQREGATAP